jgi:TRAP-type C4-dicarboxylate transport system permease small subunit
MTNATRTIEWARWLRRRAENVAALLLVLMFLFFMLQIIARYVLNYPLGWTDEASLLAWIWCTLWGAAFIVGESEEIRFDIIYSNISESVRRVFTVISGIALLFFYIVSLPASYRYVSFMKVERSAYLHIPINWLYSIFIVFLMACICRYVWLVYRAFRGAPAPMSDPAKTGD